MHLMRFFVAAQPRKTDRENLRSMRRRTHHDKFTVEFERRLLGQ